MEQQIRQINLEDEKPTVSKAMARLMKELKKGDDCTETYSEEEAMRILGVDA